MEDMVEVTDISFATTADNKDTSQVTVPTQLQLVSIAGPLIMLLKNVLFYKLSGRKRGHRWEIRMYSLIGVKDCTPKQNLSVVTRSGLVTDGVQSDNAKNSTMEWVRKLTTKSPTFEL